MKQLGNRVPKSTTNIPEDLLVFRARLAELGVDVHLPTAGPEYQLPQPFTVEGESLSDTVIRRRRER